MAEYKEYERVKRFIEDVNKFIDNLENELILYDAENIIERCQKRKTI